MSEIVELREKIKLLKEYLELLEKCKELEIPPRYIPYPQPEPYPFQPWPPYTPWYIQPWNDTTGTPVLKDSVYIS